MVSIMKAVLPLLSVAVVCGQPPWQKYIDKYSGGEAVQGGPGADHQQLMKKYTHAGGGNSNTTGFGNYEKFAHQYAGTYEKYMSSGDQSRSSSKAGGNIPKYSKKWLDQTPAKGFEKYMNVNKSDRQFMEKHGGVPHTQYMPGGAGGAGRGSDDYEMYVSQDGGWAKGNSSGDYSKYMSRGEGGASANSSAVRAYYRKQYMEEYAPKDAQSEESMKNSSAVTAYYKKKYMEEYAPKDAQSEESMKNSSAVRAYYKKKYMEEYAPKYRQEDAQTSHADMPGQSAPDSTEEETKPAAKEVTKPATQDETKPAAKQVTKPADARSQSKATQTVQPAAQDETKPAVKQATKPADARSQSKATQTVVQKAPDSEKALNNLRQQAQQSVKEQLLTMSGSTSPVTAFFAVAFMAGFCLTVFSVVRRQQSDLVFDDTADHYFLQA